MNKLPLAPKAMSVLACSIAAICSAQAVEKNEEVENIAIWGTKVKASSINLNEETMAIRQADHISDLLRVIPGVDVGGAHSLNQRISIRSLDDKDLKITIDGASQNTYMYHHMGNLQIHADILQSVDIEVGTNSVINGGLGGAVRFETKTAAQLLQGDDQFGGRAQVSYADNGGESWSLTGFGQLGGGFDFLVYHNAVSKDNYEVGGGAILDEQGLLVEGTEGKVRGLEGDVADTLLKLGWDLSVNHRIELGYEAYQDKGDYSYRPDMGLATDLAIAESLDTPLVWPTEFTRNTLTLNYDGQLGDTRLRATLFSNESRLKRDETGYADSTVLVRGAPVSDWAGYIDGQADNQGLNILAESEQGSQVVTYGFEYIDYQTTYRADYLTIDDEQSEEEAQTTSLFVQDRIELSGNFFVIPGVRYDAYDMKSATVTDKFDDVTFALAGEYYPTDSLVLKLSATELFKAPEIGEVFTGAGLYDSANPEIKAETGLNTEFAVAFERSVSDDDYFATGFTLFKTQIDDYIYDYAQRGFKDNVGDMQVDGIEAYVGYDFGPFSTMLTYSKSDSELDAFTDYEGFDSARIDRQQGDTISFNFDYNVTEWDLALHWDILNVGDVNHANDLDGASVERAKEGYTVHNISARWTPSQVKGLAVTFGVDNLTDEFYASHSSRTGLSAHPLFGELYLLDYEPGRNIKLTAAYKF